MICAAGNEVREGDTITQKEVWGNMYEQFMHVYKNFHMKERNNEIFFQEVPHFNGRWPQSFTAYVDRVSTESPSADWRSRHVKLDKLTNNVELEEISFRKYYFGSKLWDYYTDAKKYINGNMNKLYVKSSSMKSGQNETGVFREVRKRLWTVECFPKAKISVDNALKTKLKNGEKKSI